MSEPQPSESMDEGDVTKAWNAAKAGDRAEMIGWLQAWLPGVAHRTARKLNSRVIDTAVIGQEASMRVYSDAMPKRWKSKEHFVNWINKIVRNIGIDFHRYEHGRRAVDSQIDCCSEQLSSETNSRPNFLPLSQADRLIQRIPAYSLVDRLSLGQALALLSTQAPRSFNVIAVRHLSDNEVLSLESTANRLGIGVRQVKSLEKNAFQFIEKHLRDESAPHGTE